MKLISIQMKTTTNFESNLKVLEKLIISCEDNSIILAPELALCGFAYENIQEAANFSKIALQRLLKLSQNKILAFTTIIEKDGKFFNTFYLLYNEKIVHTQSKVKLFKLGNEDRYFSSGNMKDIKIVDINGLKIAVLICFEIRFPALWEKIKGADIILNPAMWGVKRKKHYEAITKSLALINQVYVVASNSANSNMAKSSAIISPFGDVVKDDRKMLIKCDFNKDEIAKVRKYINIGLS